jgi:hypothetical protein
MAGVPQVDEARKRSRVPDLHRTRQVVAVLGVVQCPLFPSISQAYDEFNRQCRWAAAPCLRACACPGGVGAFMGAAGGAGTGGVGVCSAPQRSSVTHLVHCSLCVRAQVPVPRGAGHPLLCV